jgi:phage terminase small subunit
MTRGRRRTSDDLKALKANPTERRRALAQAQASQGNAAKAASPRKLSALYTPSFLRRALEKRIYSRVVDDLISRRLARAADLDAYGRWASYLARWITLDRKLKPGDEAYETESKHGKMLRKHPHFAAMIDLERVMMALEDRLGLNPAARQNIIRGIAALANTPFAGDLFAEDRQNNPQPEGEAGDAAKAEEPPPEQTPIGFLLDAQRGHQLPN